MGDAQSRLDLPFCEEVQAIKLEGFTGYVTYPVTIRMYLCGRVVGTQVLDRPGDIYHARGATEDMDGAITSRASSCWRIGISSPNRSGSPTISVA